MLLEGDDRIISPGHRSCIVSGQSSLFETKSLHIFNSCTVGLLLLEEVS